jgi:zinc protease
MAPNGTTMMRRARVASRTLVTTRALAATWTLVTTRILASACAGSLLACVGGGVPGFGYTPAWEQPPPEARIAPVVQPGALTRVTLENGLELLVLEDHRIPKLGLGITLRRGAASVTPDSAGLAQFTAELMNRGAGDRDALALAQAVDDIGASLSVNAGWDSMDVIVSGLSRDLDAMVKILGDVVLAPRFDEGEAAKTRSEQLAALEAAKDRPGTLVRNGAMRALYGEHRYGIPMNGTPETVAGLDAADARALHEAYFMPNNAILYAVGDIDADAWVEQAKSIFAGWKAGEVPAAAPPPPATTPSERKIVVVDKPDQTQARIMILHEGITRIDDRRIAAGLMNDTLGGSGFSSRMMKTLRSNEGLTYGVGSGFSLRRQPGPFYVSTFTRVAEARRAVDILLRELEDIRGPRPVDADELAKSKSYNVGQFGLGLETSASVMGSLVNLGVYGLPEDSLDTYRARVRAVTVEETTRIAQELLHPDRAAIVLLGPAEDLVPQFESLGTVKVVQP